MARPSDFTEELADDICKQMTEGKSLRSICLQDGYPHISTVMRWVAAHETFREQYACAQRAREDTLFEECLDIADETSNDSVSVTNSDGEELYEKANSEWISRSRLRIETRFKMLARMNPKKYGDSMKLTDPEGNALTVNLVQFSNANSNDSK